MPFIETTDGNYINLDHVTKIVVPRVGNGDYGLFAGDQKLGEVWPLQAERLTLQIVAAPSGYSVLDAAIDDDGHDLVEYPIIAFGFGDGYPVPFTVDGAYNSSGPWGIKCPPGKVTVQGSFDYKNTEAFLAYAKEQHHKYKVEHTKAEAERVETVE
jgi:hypothetical protein